jgi:pilus assembly protein Flp/PilA
MSLRWTATAELAAPPRRGQGMTEYILLVALVGIASIGIVSLYGNNLRALLGASSNALAGSSNERNTAAKASGTRKTLNDFGVVQGGGSDAVNRGAGRP